MSAVFASKPTTTRTKSRYPCHAATHSVSSAAARCPKTTLYLVHMIRLSTKHLPKICLLITQCFKDYQCFPKQSNRQVQIQTVISKISHCSTVQLTQAKRLNSSVKTIQNCFVQSAFSSTLRKNTMWFLAHPRSFQ